MSISIRLLTLTIILFSTLSTYSQDKTYQYQLEGTYPASLTGLKGPQNIRFTLMWNEKDLIINGIYKDSFFTKRSPVTGSIGIEGRVFKIKLPRVIQGITDLMLNENTGNVGIAMKDFLGASVSQVYIFGRVEVRPEYVEGK
jgi:hypothetical protein